MSYVTAITDRVLADVTPTPTSKGYFNVADWTRVYENARLASALAALELGTPIVFNSATAPTITTVQGIHTALNILLANIERMRLAVAGESIAGTTTEIEDNWVSGANEDAPDYTDANLWESTVDAVWEHYGGPDLENCPSLTGNLVVGTGVTQIYVGCVDTNGYDITVNDTGVMHII